MNLIEYVGSIGGVGAVFGLLFFFAFKKTVEQMREDRKIFEDRLAKLVEADQVTREKHTVVLTELIIYLKMRNGSK